MNRTRTHIAAVAFLLALCGSLAAGCRSLAPPIKWNAAQVHWESYEAGLARAKAERKPVCLVFYADWCEPCKKFSHVFEDPRVIARAKDFVMVRVNADEREDLNKKFRVGGRSIPRTYFLTQDGVLMTGAHAPRLCSRYGYDHEDPASLLAGMGLAQKLASDPTVNHAEDPFKLTQDQVALVCVSQGDDKDCIACVKANCCAEMIACTNDAVACMCATPPRGPASVQLAACLKERCTQCPVPK